MGVLRYVTPACKRRIGETRFSMQLRKVVVQMFMYAFCVGTDCNVLEEEG